MWKLGRFRKMLDYDPAVHLRKYPMPMARFGQNPYGDDLWRVVWAPSRRYLVVGPGDTGVPDAKWLPLYREIGEQWVLEGWTSAEEFAGVSREVWDANLAGGNGIAGLGPWPERGDYRWAWTFDTATVQDTNIEKVISWIVAGKGISLAEKVADAHERERRELEATRQMVRDRLADRLPAYGIRPMFSSRVARGTDLPKLQYSAEDLGLPTQAGATRSKRSQNEYEVKLPE